MRHGICKLSVVPMRREPSHTSELVSELLFNDIYEILDENEEWMRICCKYDSYEGWIRKLQHYELSEEEFNELLKKVVQFIQIVDTLNHDSRIIGLSL